jgi:hypothetical protein
MMEIGHRRDTIRRPRWVDDVGWSVHRDELGDNCLDMLLSMNYEFVLSCIDYLIDPRLGLARSRKEKSFKKGWTARLSLGFIKIEAVDLK